MPGWFWAGCMLLMIALFTGLALPVALLPPGG